MQTFRLWGQTGLWGVAWRLGTHDDSKICYIHPWIFMNATGTTWQHQTEPFGWQIKISLDDILSWIPAYPIPKMQICPYILGQPSECPWVLHAWSWWILAKVWICNFLWWREAGAQPIASQEGVVHLEASKHDSSSHCEPLLPKITNWGWVKLGTWCTVPSLQINDFHQVCCVANKSRIGKLGSIGCVPHKGASGRSVPTDPKALCFLMRSLR